MTVRIKSLEIEANSPPLSEMELVKGHSVFDLKEGIENCKYNSKRSTKLCWFMSCFRVFPPVRICVI